MTPGQERNFWGAVHALREAETLAQLGNVSGPADEPPRPGDEKGWIADWANRAREALERARKMALPGPTGALPLAAKNVAKQRASRDAARRIAAHIQEGVRRVRQASPLARAEKTLSEVSDAARALQFGFIFGGVGLTVALALVAAYLWKTKGH